MYIKKTVMLNYSLGLIPRSYLFLSRAPEKTVLYFLSVYIVNTSYRVQLMDYTTLNKHPRQLDHTDRPIH